MSTIVECKNCKQKNRNKINKCGKCKMELKIEKESYHTRNIEVINIWKKDLENKFKFDFPVKINLLEKTKIIKNNMLYTLDMAEKLASLSRDKKIFDTSASLSSIENEMDKIRKDVVSIAVFGQMSSGKSSFLNSLVGENLLSVAQERATATITIVRHIDNFNGKKNGDIEIHYKHENEIVFNVRKAINVLDKHFHNYASFELFTLDDILLNKDALLSKLETSSRKEIKREYRKAVKENKKILELILNSIDDYQHKLGTTTYQNLLTNDELTSTDKSVFINNIVFYKDIKLLKNIELVDTPGLGSNSQLDTRKSEEFIAKADIVMILTDAREPMQKESEEDILHILDDIKRDEDDANFFDKVFIVINKIDESESDRAKIIELLNESLDDAEIEISNNHILFISAKYEYLKRCDKKALKEFHLINKNNIQENDLEYIEKTIYDFSAAEATSKFLTKHLKQIDTIFDGIERNFEENIQNLENSLEKTQEKIEKFKENKEKIQSALENNLNRMIKDEYRSLLAKANNFMDDSLKERSTEDYFEKLAKKRDLFKEAHNMANTENNYQNIAKKLFESIIADTNNKIEYNIKHNVFNHQDKQILKEKLQKKTKDIQNRYENDYGVVLNLDEINIDSIKIKLTKDIDLEISIWKDIKQLFNLRLWRKTDKYIDISAESWEKYSNNMYKNNLKEEIKKQITSAEKNVQNEVLISIHNIVETIDNQLQQELLDKERYVDNKNETIYRKTKIQDSFNMLQNDYIVKAKEQNRILFK